MQILVDADACPRAVKEILFRAVQRRAISTVETSASGKSAKSESSGFTRNLHKVTPPSARGKLFSSESGFDEEVATSKVPSSAHMTFVGGHCVMANDSTDRAPK